MNNMTYYLLTPLSPLVIGNGKPFGAGERNGGQEPHPGVIAGALRASWVDEGADTVTRQTRIEQVLKQPIKGPFLLREGPNKELTFYVPQPADSLYLQDSEDKKIKAFRLAPKELPPDVGGNWPEGLAPVYLQDDTAKGKPVAGPRYWPLSDFLAWRISNASNLCLPIQPLAAPVQDMRTHVAIDSQTRAASDGQLFQTVGLDYGESRTANGRFTHERWHLAAGFEEPLNEGLITIGGERRPTWIKPFAANLQNALVDIPTDWPSSGQASSHWLCLTLLTPALLDEGWKDKAWNSEEFATLPNFPNNLMGRLVACALPRWQGISGWNMKTSGPKPSRRMVPAGTVYWFELQSDTKHEQVEKLCKDLWLLCISSADQDRSDGFGAVIPALVHKTPPASNNPEGPHA